MFSDTMYTKVTGLKFTGRKEGILLVFESQFIAYQRLLAGDASAESFSEKTYTITIKYNILRKTWEIGVFYQIDLTAQDDLGNIRQKALKVICAITEPVIKHYSDGDLDALERLKVILPGNHVLEITGIDVSVAPQIQSLLHPPVVSVETSAGPGAESIGVGASAGPGNASTTPHVAPPNPADCDQASAHLHGDVLDQSHPA